MQVKGFLAAAVKAGIRYPDRLDLGLIFSRTPAVTAGMLAAKTSLWTERNSSWPIGMSAAPYFTSVSLQMKNRQASSIATMPRVVFPGWDIAAVLPEK